MFYSPIKQQNAPLRGVWLIKSTIDKSLFVYQSKQVRKVKAELKA